MTIYPAIDIINGECVRLVKGDYSQKTTYSKAPVDVAKRWEAAGADFIHTVDLDGAKSGSAVNFEVIAEIAAAVSVKIEVGGGIRTQQSVDRYFDCGVSRVILGTSALNDPDFVKWAVDKYGDKIAVGIDAKDGMAAVSGWEDVSKVSALELAARMKDIGVKNIIYTDIATDGMLSGPNLAAMSEMVRFVGSGVNIIASGGVSCADDVEKLKSTGVEGVIIGKALYTGNINLSEVILKGSQ